MRRFLQLAALLLPLALAAPAVVARTSVPIQNHENVSVTTASGKKATPAQIKAGFESAASALGWQLSQPAGGQMIATLHVRGKHTIAADVSYKPGVYSVKYRSSVNMNYAPGEGAGVIHPHYNKWLQALLDRARADIARQP